MKSALIKLASALTGSSSSGSCKRKASQQDVEDVNGVDFDIKKHVVLTPEPERTTDCVGPFLKLVRVLQAGAHGRVYDAYLTTAPDVRIAVKVSFADMDSRRETLAMEIFRHSQHKNVMSPLYPPETNAEDFVMQYLPYCVDDALWFTKKRISDNKAQHIAFQLLSAVQHCHRLGVFHRDIKPENVLIYVEPNSTRASQQYVKLTDFGAAYVRGIESCSGHQSPSQSPSLSLSPPPLLGMASPLELPASSTASPALESMSLSVTPVTFAEAMSTSITPTAPSPSPEHMRLRLQTPVETAAFRPYVPVSRPGDNRGNAGTVAYMAPEYLMNSGCVKKTAEGSDDFDLLGKLDVWSTGVTLFVIMYAAFPPCIQDEVYSELFEQWEAAYSARDVATVAQMLAAQIPCRDAVCKDARAQEKQQGCICRGMCPKAVSFFLTMLDPNPATRCTVEEALNHEWLASVKSYYLSL